MNTVRWLFCLALLTTACASSRTAHEAAVLSPTEIAALMEQRSDALVAIDAEGTLYSSVDGSGDQAQFTYSLYRTDSLLLTLYGPFGIVVGKLQANPDNFYFFDALSNEMYEGASSRENFGRILNIPLSHREIARLLRGEPPHDLSSYTAVEPSATFPVFLRRSDGAAERVIYSQADSAITEYARKNTAGETILVVRYSEFSTVQGIRLAHNVTFQLPQAQISVHLQSSSMATNVSDRKYSFAHPKGVKRNRY